MFIGLGIGVGDVALRLALRGRFVPLLSLLSAVAAALAVAIASGFLARLNERLHYSQTNTGRATIYQESFDGAVKAPIFGNGAPRASETVDVAVGTQGQIWNLMFSYGFIALTCFVLGFLVAAWQSRRAEGPEGLWVSAVLVVALVTFTYYGYHGPQLAVAMAAAALAMRGADPVAGFPDGQAEGEVRERGSPPARVFR